MLLAELGLTEEKMSNWRAVARMDDGSEALVTLGRSNTFVRANYCYALDSFQEPERIIQIMLEQWQGSPSCGHWVTRSELIAHRKSAVAVGPGFDLVEAA